MARWWLTVRGFHSFHTFFIHSFFSSSHIKFILLTTKYKNSRYLNGCTKRRCTKYKYESIQVYVYESNLCSFQNSWPIGLTLMVVLSECYLQKVECKAIMETLNYKIAPKTYWCFVDDSHARFQERSHVNKFQISNKQDPAINKIQQ